VEVSRSLFEQVQGDRAFIERGARIVALQSGGQFVTTNHSWP
jgi:hypothetical protein